MTAFTIAFPLVITALFGLLFSVIPSWMPPGLPLGARVPQAHATDPVIGAALRRFRWSLLVAWLITAAGTVALLFVDVVLTAVVPILAYAVLAVAALILSRRIILRAKKEGKWFEGVPVRVSAQITPVAYEHPPIVLPVLAAVVLAVATGVNIARYPTLPDRIPIHFGFDGTPDSWAAKSIWSVFGVLIIAASVVVLLTALSFVAARFTTRPQPDDSAEQARLRVQVQRKALTSLLAELSFVIALGFSALTLAPTLLPGVRWAIAGSAIGMVVLVVVVLATMVIRIRTQLRPANERDGTTERPDAADDDSHWKGAIFYVNRDDPALVVPRRFGMGWTLNLGRPAGVALGILLLVVIAGVVITAVLLSHAR